VEARLSKDAEAFLDKRSGMSRDYVEAHAVEAARRNEELIAAEMRELAEHPLDLTGVPDVEQVLASLVLNDFFTKPTWDLGAGYPISVREWLLRGGGPEPVLLYAESYLLGG
jgi:hypothetical protein